MASGVKIDLTGVSIDRWNFSIMITTELGASAQLLRVPDLLLPLETLSGQKEVSANHPQASFKSSSNLHLILSIWLVITQISSVKILLCLRKIK